MHSRGTPLRINADEKVHIIHYHGPSTMDTANKRILLIDHDDSRRDSRVKLLLGQGYDMDVHEDHLQAQGLDHNCKFDLIILALYPRAENATS